MAGSSLEIVGVPALSDNYLWLLHDRLTGQTAVVDPGDGAPVLMAADSRGWKIDQILNTHWHPDHTGGNLVIKATGAQVLGPAMESTKIPGIDVHLREGGQVRVGSHTAEVWEVPGHTLGHIAFVFRDAGVAFVGDTMFAMGCGRLFEGTPAQMYASLKRLGELSAETQVYCAHEYTLGNARFAAHVEPTNGDVGQRLQEVEASRSLGRATVPTTIALERATNPFLRAPDLEVFTSLRAKKDQFGS
jgi:hydroxyacylglutathione hydrolase